MARPQYTCIISDRLEHNYMIHKVKYFEADKLSPGVFLQDIVNDFLAEKGDRIIAVHPVMERSILVHYKEDF
jgi:hypothetical protein